jgi:hypothetical protein
MAKQLVLGSVLGAVVLFIWSAIAWMVIPWPGQPLRSFTNEDAVGQAISANAPRSGNYLLPNLAKRTPGMTDQQYAAAEKAMADRWARGPIVFAAVRLEPFDRSAAALVIQFFTQLLLALLATLLLLQTSGLSRAGRIAFVAAIGVIIFVGGHVDEWNWWSFSNAYMLMQFGAIVIGWVLAALVISTFVRGKAAIA